MDAFVSLSKENLVEFFLIFFSSFVLISEQTV